MAGVSFNVLGPLEATAGGEPLDLKGPRHRAVLARLLIAGGRVVPLARLIDDLWDDPPAGAAGAVQTFVAALRRALEPDRPPRAPARLLVSVAPGYALRTEPEAVDAWRFEAGVRDAARLLAEGRAAQALARLDEGLRSWRGPAYAQFAEEDWARGKIARLDGLRLLAVERRAEAVLALGRPAEAAVDLEAHVTGHPLREDAWRLLALALYRTDRQGDALGVLRRARQILREELGVDPGPELRRLEADILAQAPHLHPVPQPATTERRLVGRDRELAELEHTRERLALISGDAGMGKTTLAEALSSSLASQGWTVAWGRSPEEGAPAGWPWTEMLGTLTAAGFEATPSTGDDRFSAHRAIAAFVAEVAREAPLLLVFDDLHWAGEETLSLLTSLVTSLDSVPDLGRVLIVATFRDTEIPDGLAAALGRLARAEPVRLRLGGLPANAVEALVRTTAGEPVDARATRTIQERSGGNPFFVRELARLLRAEGQAALSAVPAGVRDVIRHRLAKLPEQARTTLRLAAVIGQDFDLDVLAALEGDVLDAVDAALSAGFIIERDGGSLEQDSTGRDGLAFAHALVRETLYADLSGPRRARRHAEVAEVLERLRPADIEAIAHHLLKSGQASKSGEASAKTVRYVRMAAERAEQRFAPHEAARLWHAAIHAHDGTEDHDGTEQRLDLVMGLVRALAVTGDLDGARRHRAAAITTAGSLPDPQAAAEIIGAFTTPANWPRNDDEQLSRLIVDVTTRTLAALPPSTDPASERARARLLGTIAMETRGGTQDHGREAARKAEEIARRLDDPALLAFALNGRFLHTFERTGLAPERAGLGADLIELSRRHHLVVFEVLGHLIMIQSRSALADFASADEHAAAATRLAERHDVPLVAVFTGWYGALKTAVAGRPAEPAYRQAAARLTGSGMPGMEEGLLPLALLCLRLQGAAAPTEIGDLGPYEPWARPLTLLATGQREDAAKALHDLPESPCDLLLEVRLCLAAIAAIDLGDRTTMERLYDDLLPAAGELAGAGSGVLTLRPVAAYLADLATALNRTPAATQHHDQARAIAEQAASTAAEVR
ncbi:BTAD domain-containing putative transcriptional regulator [Actinomadura sp. 9N407]|uniref:BTAD domain-containing putative transcriptional regulator n=1 Tax=Actinomadura sp. 9N407 TaxID=3375154 RepID=UPI0037B90BA3